MPQHFDEAERGVLAALDELVWAPRIRRAVDRIVAELERELAAGSDALVWRTVPLEAWGALPDAGIRSSWVFLLRAGVATGAERHPNSRQRMASYRGSGDFPVKAELSDPWLSNRLSSEPDAPLERRWVSVPPSTWHQGVVDAGVHWAVVSFQTAPADELIEERPDPSASAGLARRLYAPPRG